MTAARDELTYLVVWHLRLDTSKDGDGTLFLDWLLGDYRKTPSRPYTPWLTRLMPELWPDVCCVCGAGYGLTPAGRVRRGCPACLGDGDAERLFAWRRWTGTDIECPEFFRLAKQYRKQDYDFR